MKKKYFIIMLMVIMLMPVMGVNAVTCGNVTKIPAKIPQLTSLAITIIQIAVPIILVILGMLDLFKGMTAQKEDEIKKATGMFVKRLVVAVIIFFVVVIVKLVISLVADSNTESENIVSCIDCFISNRCEADSSTSNLNTNTNTGNTRNEVK